MQKSLTWINQQAWTARFSGDYDRAHELIVMAKLRLGMSPGDVQPADLEALLGSGASKGDAAAQTMCLVASLERFNGKVEQAESLLQSMERFLKIRGRAGLPDLYLQKGLNQLVQGQYLLAIESFSAASSLTEDLLIKAVSNSNKLLCMEALAIPLQSALGELENILAETPQNPVKNFVSTQMQALKGRQAFRNGSVADLFMMNSSQLEISQPDFMRQYIARLPYVKCEVDLRSSWEFFVSQHRLLLQGSFRLRTLLGQYEESDFEKARPCDLADRLYLWVWLWLKDPQGFGLVKVMRLLRHIDFERDIWTYEDLTQIRLALLWLGLFSHVEKDEIVRLTASHPSQGLSMPLYELERLVIDYLYARKTQDFLLATEIWKTLESHPLWNSNSILFKDLIDLNQESQLNKLAFAFVVMNPVSRNDQKITVDLRCHTVFEKLTGLEHKSEVLSSALNIFRKRVYLSCPELLKEVFGIGRYDPYIHDKKIHNLLYRLRRLVGDQVRFHIKCGVVYSEGSWDAFDFIDPSQHEADLASFGNWFGEIFQHRTGTSATGKRLLSEKDLTSLEGKWISRAQIQTQLRKPRSTTCRILSEWVKSGLVLKKGHARNSFYQLQPQLIAHLREERKYD